jgi:hypothetical protein
MTLSKPSRLFTSGDATTLFLTLPAAVVSDSQFPFAADDTVQVTIEGDSVRITPLPDHSEAGPSE